MKVPVYLLALAATPVMAAMTDMLGQDPVKQVQDRQTAAKTEYIQGGETSGMTPHRPAVPTEVWGATCYQRKPPVSCTAPQEAWDMYLKSGGAAGGKPGYENPAAPPAATDATGATGATGATDATGVTDPNATPTTAPLQ